MGKPGLHNRVAQFWTSTKVCHLEIPVRSSVQGVAMLAVTLVGKYDQLTYYSLGV